MKHLLLLTEYTEKRETERETEKQREREEKDAITDNR